MDFVTLADWRIKLEDFTKDSNSSEIFKRSLRQSKDGRYAFLFYDDVEAPMGTISSSLAILTNITNPIVIFDSKGFKFSNTFEEDLVFGETTSIVILGRHCYEASKSISDNTFCLLDFINHRFSILSFENCDFYSLNEIAKGIFQIILVHPNDLKRYQEREKKVFKARGGENVYLARLPWIPLAELKNYVSIYCASPQSFIIQ